MASFTKAEIAARDARLDNLEAAVKDFAKSEVERLENESKFIWSALSGRGADQAAVTNLLSGSVNLEIEIARFLEAGA